MVKNVLEIALVHHKPLIEDYDPVCHTGNRIQVMGDKDHRCLVFLLDPQHQAIYRQALSNFKLLADHIASLNSINKQMNEQ